MKKKIFAITMMLAMMLTMFPMLPGNDAHAMAAKKRVAKKVTLYASSNGQTSVNLSWNKIKSPNKGYAVFRNGVAIKHFGKKTTRFTDSGLKAGTSYTYQIKTYTKKTKKMYYNKKTGKWQRKRPAKKYRGKSKKMPVYSYKKKSNTVSVRTAAAPKEPTVTVVKPTVKPALEAPVAPAVTNLTVTGKSNNSISIKWTGNADQYRIKAGSAFDITKLANNATVTNLSPGTTYTIEVYAMYYEKCKWTTSAATTVRVATSGSGSTSGNPITPSGNRVIDTVTDFEGVEYSVLNDGYTATSWREISKADAKTPRYNKTVNGEFTLNGKSYIQSDGVTFETEIKALSIKTTVINGDISKLTYAPSEQPVSKQFTDSFGNNKTVKVFTKNGNPVAVYWETGSSNNKTVNVTDYSYVGEIDKPGIGFEGSKDINIRIVYAGKVIKVVPMTINKDADSQGLSPYKHDCYALALEAVEDYRKTMGMADDPELQYALDMQAISDYIYNNYEYKDFGLLEACHCTEVAECQEAWSVVTYGYYGRFERPYSYNTSHISFRDSHYNTSWGK